MKIADLRAQVGWTQAQLARATKMSPAALNRLEHLDAAADQVVRPATAMRVLNALNAARARLQLPDVSLNEIDLPVAQTEEIKSPLALYREALGWSQNDLAQVAGVRPETVLRQERARSPSIFLKTAQRLLDALNNERGSSGLEPLRLEDLGLTLNVHWRRRR